MLIFWSISPSVNVVKQSDLGANYAKTAERIQLVLERFYWSVSGSHKMNGILPTTLPVAINLGLHHFLALSSSHAAVVISIINTDYTTSRFTWLSFLWVTEISSLFSNWSYKDREVVLFTHANSSHGVGLDRCLSVCLSVFPPNLTRKCPTMRPGNPLVLGSWALSYKHCWRGSLHSHECWLLLIVSALWRQYLHCENINRIEQNWKRVDEKQHTFCLTSSFP